MYTITSYQITEDYKASEVRPEEWKFQIENGNTGELTISDVLLDTEELATERAKSEFLQNSYKQNEINLITPRTDYVKNQTIQVYGTPYLIKGISTRITGVDIITTLRGVRYE